MAKLRNLRLEADFDNGDVNTILNFIIDDDGMARLDQKTLDFLAETPETAKIWGTALCSSGKVLLTAVDVYKSLTPDSREER